MKYAVIKFQGHQHRVSEGEEILVDQIKIGDGENKEIKISDVLLIVDGDEVKIGQPVIQNAYVQAEIKENLRGTKIRVAKYKAKARYRKVKGHRSYLTKIKIVKIHP